METQEGILQSLTLEGVPKTLRKSISLLLAPHTLSFPPTRRNQHGEQSPLHGEVAGHLPWTQNLHWLGGSCTRPSNPQALSSTLESRTLVPSRDSINAWWINGWHLSYSFGIIFRLLVPNVLFMDVLAPPLVPWDYTAWERLGVNWQ